MTTNAEKSAVEKLTEYVKAHGPIKTVRVSSAQARGSAKDYPYWGAVRYAIRLNKAGILTHTACERASSDRRAWHLAVQDAEEIAEREHRMMLPSRLAVIGPVPEEVAAYVLASMQRATSAY